MFKADLLFILFILFISTLAQADIELKRLIEKNIIEEKNLASDVQQYAGIESQTANKNTTYYSKNKKSKEPDFTLVLRNKSEKKNPVIHRSVASKESRVNKKTIKKTTKKKSKAKQKKKKD